MVLMKSSVFRNTFVSKHRFVQETKKESPHVHHTQCVSIYVLFHKVDWKIPCRKTASQLLTTSTSVCLFIICVYIECFKISFSALRGEADPWPQQDQKSSLNLKICHSRKETHCEKMRKSIQTTVTSMRPICWVQSRFATRLNQGSGFAQKKE